jgi:hypothetical protein
MNTNSPRYRFRAKRYGLGWKVLRWTFTGAMIILLLVVCYWKGEPSGRRWNSGR